MMLEKMLKTFQKLRLEFYRKIFTRVRERDGSLSAMEVFSLEIIYALGRPTIGQFARFIGISQSNATYKVNSLMKKGYIIRQPSQEDGREYNLELSEKFYGYSDMLEENVRTITRNVLEQLTPEEIAVIDKAADILNKELDARAGLIKRLAKNNKPGNIPGFCALKDQLWPEALYTSSWCSASGSEPTWERLPSK